MSLCKDNVLSLTKKSYSNCNCTKLKKENINKKILRYLKRYIKQGLKDKSISYSSLISDSKSNSFWLEFVNENIFPPCVREFNGKKIHFKSFNEKYIRYIFSFKYGMEIYFKMLSKNKFNLVSNIFKGVNIDILIKNDIKIINNKTASLKNNIITNNDLNYFNNFVISNNKINFGKINNNINIYNNDIHSVDTCCNTNINSLNTIDNNKNYYNIYQIVLNYLENFPFLYNDKIENYKYELNTEKFLGLKEYSDKINFKNIHIKDIESKKKIPDNICTLKRNFKINSIENDYKQFISFNNTDKVYSSCVNANEDYNNLINDIYKDIIDTQKKHIYDYINNINIKHNIYSNTKENTVLVTLK